MSQGRRADARVPICGLFPIQEAGNRPLRTESASLTHLLLKSSIWGCQPSLQEKAIEEKSKSLGIGVCAVICCGRAFHEQPLQVSPGSSWTPSSPLAFLLGGKMEQREELCWRGREQVLTELREPPSV